MIPQTFITTIQIRAKRRNIIFQLDKKYLIYLFKKQNGKCAYTGIQLILPKNNWEVQHSGFSNISLDRINSNKGYIKGNVQWVTKEINRLKNDLVPKIFIQLCEQVAQYNKDSQRKVNKSGTSNRTHSVETNKSKTKII